MGSSDSQLAEKRVVVIGGGYAGFQVAGKLNEKCKVTLIDPKDGMHANTTSPRACVEPGFARKTFIPYAPLLGEQFKKGWVQEIKISEKVVVLEEKQEEVPYDYLIIATGSAGNFPGKLKREASVQDGIRQYEKLIELVKSVQKITVIGGGASGTEIAGEIKVDYPDKEVTLIHSSDVLINSSMKRSFTDRLHEQLNAVGVKMLLGERVCNLSEIPLDGSEKCIVKTDKGTEVEADLVFLCISLKPNTEAYSKSLSDCMDDRGYLKVRPTLQVEGHDDIFAIGDCAIIDDIKMAYYAGLHCDVVAKNIEVLATNCGSLKKYKPGPPLMAVTVGRTGGAFQAGPLVFGKHICRNIKSTDMMLPRMWSIMNTKYTESNMFKYE